MALWKINPEEKHRLESIAERVAYHENVAPKLLMAIVDTESEWQQWACRYEPGWRWFLSPRQWAARLRQSTKTEWVQQATSFGLGQIMGAVARELGYEGYLAELCDPEVNLMYCAKKLKQLTDKYDNVDDVFAAYNAGSPRRNIFGQYVNWSYVNKASANFAARIKEGDR